jgi:hypothetical protein
VKAFDSISDSELDSNEIDESDSQFKNTMNKEFPRFEGL